MIGIGMLTLSAPSTQSTASPISLTDLDLFLFGSSTSEMPSYAYRIDAARLLARTLVISRERRCGSDAAHCLDVAVMNRVLGISWPQRIITDDLKIDEMMAQARMLLSS
jgi:hypothetical protein